VKTVVSSIALLMVVGALVIFVLGVPALADTIVMLPIDPAIVSQPPSSGRFDFPFPDLNGVVLNGDTLSANFIFAGSVLARARVLSPPNTSADLGVGLLLQADGIVHGLPGSQPTGFLLAPDGTPAFPPLFAGQALSDDGRYFVGLSQFPSGVLSQPVFDFEGLHLNVYLPGFGGQVVTGAEIMLTVGGFTASTLQFGTEAQLPEPGTWILLALGLLGPLCWRANIS
jgi:hypothetical protein